MNKKLSIAMLALILATTGAYFIHVATSIISPMRVAEKFVLNFSGSKTENEFADTLSLLSLDYFRDVRVPCATRKYSNILKSGDIVSNKIDKVFLINTEASSADAVVYYTETNIELGSKTPMQANVIIRKSNGEWLIDEAYIMKRKSDYIPKTASEEAGLQISRINNMSTVLTNMLSNRSEGKIDEYMSVFADNSIEVLIEDKFINEQTYLKSNNISLTITDVDVIPLSTSDSTAKCILKYTLNYGDSSKVVYLSIDLAEINNIWKITWVSNVNN